MEASTRTADSLTVRGAKGELGPPPRLLRGRGRWPTPLSPMLGGQVDGRRISIGSDLLISGLGALATLSAYPLELPGAWENGPGWRRGCRGGK